MPFKSEWSDQWWSIGTTELSKNTVCAHNKLGESPEDYAEYKEPTPEGYVLDDSIYGTFLK